MTSYSASAATAPSAAQQPDPRRWRALTVCMAGGFVAMLDVSVVNVALPSIQTALHAGSAQIQMIVAGYTLALALLVVPAGRLGDMRGRRIMFIIGVTGFGVMSLLAGLATSDTELAIVRVLQGAFAGVLNPQNAGLIQQMFIGKERARAFGVMGATIGVATALGPVVGGLIVTLAGTWRWVFFINVPIVAVVVPLARRLLPPPAHPVTSERLDVPGIGMIGLAAVCVMTPFVLSAAETESGAGANASPWRWAFIGVAVLVLVGFVAWERRYQTRYGAAVLDPALVRNVGFRFGVLVGMAYFAGFTSIFLMVTMVLQRGLGYSPLMAGLIGAPFAVGSGLASPIAGRMVGHFGRVWVVGGLSLMLVGLLATDAVLRWASVGDLAWILAITLFLTGLGSGSVISPNQALTLASVPPRIGGVAGGVLQVGQQVGASIGMSIVLSTFFINLTLLGARGSAAQALIASMGVILLALCIAIIDWQRRRNHAEVLA
ncbi:MAG: MFS transporter [Micrococcales bacterium]|nr:MFS transporter [Micrococcales bacterium]